MNPIELEITYLDGKTVTVETIAADLVAFETKFNIAVSRLQDDPRVTYMFYLAWHALKRTGGTKDDFDKWVNTVSGIGQAEVKKIKGLGPNSVHWVIAQLAVETGISPSELISLEPRMLWTIQRYMISKSQNAKKGRR